MREPLRIGVVGAGAIARAYVEAIAAVPGARLVATADSNAEAALALAASCGATPFASHHDLGQRGGCDAAIICTPPRFHAAGTLGLRDRGTVWLCENPLSIAEESARAMLDCAGRAGVVLAMASKFRYVPAVTAARDLVTSGALGELIQVENVFSGRIDMSRRWN